MAELPKLTYTKSWEDPVDFPTVETSEAQVRGDLQRLFSETRDYLNQKLVPAVEEAIREGGEGTGSAPGSGASQGDGVDLSGYLRKEGGTMTGPLLLSRQPQSDMEAATRKYAASAAEDVRSALGQRASELGRGVEDLTARVTDLEENGSRELRETVTALSGRMESAEGDLSSLRQSAETITAQVESLEGDVATVRETAEGLSTQVYATEGNVSELQQTADGLTTRVESVEGVNTSLQQSAAGFLARAADTESGLSAVTQKVESISLSVENVAAGDAAKAVIALTVGDRTHRGEIALSGNVDVSGQLSAQALYAAQGDIANLTVDSFSSSRRIPLYLAGDTSDDNYIRVKDERLEFVSGVCTGGVEQARDPYGARLYWEEDPAAEGTAPGEDGYPRNSAGRRVYTTTAPTDWPVRVYAYEEQVKARFSFRQEENGVYTPTLALGAGNAAGTNQAYLRKGVEGLELLYTGTNGKQAGLRGTTDGYLDVTGLRRTTGLNFSDWESGSFRERLEGLGDEGVQTYRVTFDGEGRPTKITYPDDLELMIYW